jgi:hypothetical protein
MDKLKLSDFDLFAYLSSGLAALFTADLLFGTSYVLGLKGFDADALLLLFAAYVAGHVVALPSYIVMEQLLLGAVLLRPSTLLMPHAGTRMRRPLRVLRALRLTEYGDPLDPSIQRRIRERFAAEGRGEPEGAARYWAIYPSIYAPRDAHQPASGRIELFGKLFNFARNLATVSLVFTLATVAKRLAGHANAPVAGLGWGAQAGIGAALTFALILRFLKFYHMQAAEMFIVYSQGDPDARKAQGD